MYILMNECVNNVCSNQLQNYMYKMVEIKGESRNDVLSVTQDMKT